MDPRNSPYSPSQSSPSRTPRSSLLSASDTQREAALGLMRSELEAIYGTGSSSSAPAHSSTPRPAATAGASQSTSTPAQTGRVIYKPSTKPTYQVPGGLSQSASPASAASSGVAIQDIRRPSSTHTATPTPRPNQTRPASVPAVTSTPQPTHTAAAHSSVPAQYQQQHANPQLSKESAEQWKRYHTAWQNYYQKYYEQYYMAQMKQRLAASNQAGTKDGSGNGVIDGDSLVNNSQYEKQVALQELRNSIVAKAAERARKIRRSRHFWPITLALSVVAVVALMQYNQVIVAQVKAYVSPGTLKAQNIIINPSANIPVGPENRMIIPKINVDAPTVYNVGPTNEDQLKAMANGIAHVRYPGATALPGQVGNSVYSAHSSSDWADAGEYKFIFVQLERLTKDDVIYIHYNSKRYAYKVYETKVVGPNDVGALNYTGKDPILTLITCTPLGTAQKRLLVFAKQVSPSPAEAQKPEKQQAASTNSSGGMAGTPPTFLERLFGAR